MAWRCRTAATEVLRQMKRLHYASGTFSIIFLPKQFIIFYFNPAIYVWGYIKPGLKIEIAYQRARLSLYYEGENQELSHMNIGLVVPSFEVSICGQSKYILYLLPGLRSQWYKRILRKKLPLSSRNSSTFCLVYFMFSFYFIFFYRTWQRSRHM